MSSSLLINESPLQVLPSLATLIGLNEAIILQQIHYWISDNRSKTVIEGRRWVYNTYEQWQEQFPFWCKNTIIKAIQELRSKKVLLIREGLPSENRLKYYSIDYQVLKSLESDTNEMSIPPSTKIDTSTNNEHTPVYRDLVDASTEIWLTPIYKEHARVSETTTEIREDTHARVTSNPLQDSPFIQEVSLSQEKKSKKGTRLDENWTLPSTWREWSINLGMMNEEIDKTAFKFKGYWLSTAKNPTKLDWFRTWQNYCVKECEYKGIKLNTNKLMDLSQAPQTSIPVSQSPVVQKQSTDPNIQKWYELQPKLRDMMGQANYNSWIERNIEVVKINGKALFKVISLFRQDYIMRTFGRDLLTIVSLIDPTIRYERDIEFIIVKEL